MTVLTRAALAAAALSLLLLTPQLGAGVVNAAPPPAGPPPDAPTKPPATEPPPGMAPTVVKALARCRVCHGKALTGQRDVPNIAGLKKGRVNKALGSAVPRPMRPIVRRLTEADKAAIVQYVTKLPKPETRPAKK